MKYNRILVLVLLLLSATSMFSQNVEGVVRVKNRDDILKKLPTEVAYFMPSFKEGILIYTNATSSTGLLNICLVDNSVRFINNAGDTLVMAGMQNVNRVLVGDTLLLKTNEGYVKQLMLCGNKSISQRKRFKFEEPKSEAGYAGVPKTSTATTASAREMGSTFSFDYEVEIPYSLKTEFVLTENDKVYPAKILSFCKLFPEKKKEIKNFVKEKSIDFSNKNDLATLLLFCVDKQ